MVNSVKEYRAWKVASTLAILALGPLVMTSSASANCSDGRQHWVGMAGYYGVPWAYSDFFDSDKGCRNTHAYAPAPNVTNAKRHAVVCPRIGHDGLTHP